jgi:PHD/YefM family antitoxin component YafN of YafNO toxin-antitoxin module
MSGDFRVESDKALRSISAQEIKRRGISVVDKRLEDGPVFVTENDDIQYVVMTEAFYRELLAEADEASSYRIRESLEDVAAGRVSPTSVEELIGKAWPRSG